MEEQKAPELASAAAASQALPPRPPPPSSSSSTKKRPLDSDSSFQNSNFFKIRALVRDLRPLFLEVMQSADYQNCKASHEIREQLKILMNLYENLKADVGKSRNMLDGQNVDHKTPQDDRSPWQLQAEKAFAGKLAAAVSGLQVPATEDCQAQGTYVVGGSAFGWNFITFSGHEPVYYGRTKEQFREVNQRSNSSAPCPNSPQPLD